MFCSIYLYKHDHAFPQNLTDWNFDVEVTLEYFLFQKLACSQVKCLTWSIKPTAIQPLLTCIKQSWIITF